MKSSSYKNSGQAFVIAVLLLFCGCSEEKIIFNEVKHPDERLKTSELNQFLQIVKSLPGKKLPALPPLYAPVPRWDASRELSVKGLIKEEQKRLPNRWFTESVLAELKNNHKLVKVIQKYNLSIEQFLGLTETIAMAASRTHFENIIELRIIARTGQREVSLLLKTDEVFSRFREEERFELIRKAAWLTRLDRARNLIKVPEENVELLRRHWEIISPYLPEDALRDPLEDIVDSLHDYGLPFEEIPESGSDISLKWSPLDENAIIGRDKPFNKTLAKK